MNLLIGDNMILKNFITRAMAITIRKILCNDSLRPK